MKTVEILTPRLLLRTALVPDAELVQPAKLAVWDELQRWMVWAYDDQIGLDALRAHIVRSLEVSPWQFLLGFRRDTGAFALAAGLIATDEGSYDTGYWVAADQRRQGFATEACNAQIRYAFEALRAQEVSINYFAGNDKSAAVIRKLRFPFERTVRGAHSSCVDGSPVDVHYFRRETSEELPPLDVSWR
ncbi:MAG: GNAT family N-acetyltransferase [Polyangiales bacterium]